MCECRRWTFRFCFCQLLLNWTLRLNCRWSVASLRWLALKLLTGWYTVHVWKRGEFCYSCVQTDYRCACVIGFCRFNFNLETRYTTVPLTDWLSHFWFYRSHVEIAGIFTHPRPDGSFTLRFSRRQYFSKFTKRIESLPLFFRFHTGALAASFFIKATFPCSMQVFQLLLQIVGISIL